MEATATRTEPMPKELKKWIKGFCEGKEHILVGHRMGNYPEHLGNVHLEEALCLIRDSEQVTAYTGEDKTLDKERQKLVKVFVADCVKKVVLAKFARANYWGD